jgi:competence protein ComEA
MKKLIICLIALTLPVLAQKPLETYKLCSFSKTEWADGDSFLVKLPTGEAISVRLYGCDCIEWHVNDATDSRRLRAQRSYFGITHIDPDPQQAAAVAKSYGEKAAQFVEQALRQPFTVHTAKADARGDANFSRVYAFIVTADGKDLSQELVKNGLARAFGVTRVTYHSPPQTAREYGAALGDLELQAATNKRGVWSKTNWNELPAERKNEREEAAKDLIGIDQPKNITGQKINPNTATQAELMGLPGIGEVTAKNIIAARPFKQSKDLLKVSGIGPKTLEKFQEFLVFE